MPLTREAIFASGLGLAVNHLEAAGLEFPLVTDLLVFIIVVTGAHPFHLLGRGTQFEDSRRRWHGWRF